MNTQEIKEKAKIAREMLKLDRGLNEDLRLLFSLYIESNIISTEMSTPENLAATASYAEMLVKVASGESLTIGITPETVEQVEKMKGGSILSSEFDLTRTRLPIGSRGTYEIITLLMLGHL